MNWAWLVPCKREMLPSAKNTTESRFKYTASHQPYCAHLLHFASTYIELSGRWMDGGEGWYGTHARTGTATEDIANWCSHYDMGTQTRAQNQAAIFEEHRNCAAHRVCCAILYHPNPILRTVPNIAWKMPSLKTHTRIHGMRKAHAKSATVTRLAQLNMINSVMEYGKM